MKMSAKFQENLMIFTTAIPRQTVRQKYGNQSVFESQPGGFTDASAIEFQL